MKRGSFGAEDRGKQGTTDAEQQRRPVGATSIAAGVAASDAFGIAAGAGLAAKGPRPGGKRTAAQLAATDAALAPLPPTLAALNARIVACERCPRLRSYCETIAREKRRAYREHTYWGKPVPSFGDPGAKVLLLGLAPGAHGSNRTGRPFTGDGSGAFLYPLLWEAGFSSQPVATSREDGMTLSAAWISSVVRCAPPDNKPNPAELASCAPYLDEELALLTSLRVVLALGKIAFDGYTAWLTRNGRIARRSAYTFQHGAEYALPDGRWLLAAYHPSLQNTNTGRLTAPMLLRVLVRARSLAGMDEPGSGSAVSVALG